jgi:hypothetical protein
MTVPGLEKYSRQRRLEAYLRNRYDAFLYKAFRTVSPGAELKWNWHIGLMAEYLEACRRWEITRLVINIPPRKGSGHNRAFLYAKGSIAG